MTLTKKILHTARRTLALADLEETTDNLRAVITAMKDEREERGVLGQEERIVFRSLLAE